MLLASHSRWWIGTVSAKACGQAHVAQYFENNQQTSKVSQSQERKSDEIKHTIAVLKTFAERNT
jgi:hypothetical protein